MRSGETHFLAHPIADAHQQLATGSAITIPRSAVAVILGARAQTMWVTFDDTAPSSTNGLAIVVSQPVYIPLGYHAHELHQLRTVQSAATGFLDVLFLA